jgi:PAB-dependent poly(A)-specific ribonuclease subunit 3
MPQDEIWTYMVSIASALRRIHENNLAVRQLDLTKIIMTDKHRVRLSGCAVQDVIDYRPGVSIPSLQQEDLTKLGQCMLSLATGIHPDQMAHFSALDALSQCPYSDPLKEVIRWLVTPHDSPKTVDILLRGLAEPTANLVEMVIADRDNVSGYLARELANGRIARLMMKLGTINERGDFGNDPNWSENGDRYILKLFRDYVFHRVDENGKPSLDMGHMIESLNKLDAGTQELIRLTSRDGMDEFIIAYREVKKMLDAAFGELQKASRPAVSGRF